MIGIPILANDERPVWWENFLSDITPMQDRQDLPRWERYGSWLRDIHNKLVLHGGALHRMKAGNEFLITFRVDSNYTMFLLKYS